MSIFHEHKLIHAEMLNTSFSNLIASANFILILATIIALPISRGAGQRNDAKFIFGTSANLTTWSSPGFAWFSQLVESDMDDRGFDSCVHMSEEASNATKAVPYGILMRQVYKYPIPFHPYHTLHSRTFQRLKLNTTYLLIL
jgi:hypothetical protein